MALIVDAKRIFEEGPIVGDVVVGDVGDVVSGVFRVVVVSVDVVDAFVGVDVNVVTVDVAVVDGAAEWLTLVLRQRRRGRGGGGSLRRSEGSGCRSGCRWRCLRRLRYRGRRHCATRLLRRRRQIRLRLLSAFLPAPSVAHDARILGSDS